MVDISRPSGVEPASGADRERRQDDRDEKGGRPRPQIPSLHSARRIQDVTQIMGIPAGEVTPRVQEALTIIVGEFDRTRAELDRERERAGHFQELADRHPLFPVLNRPAFTRDLARLINRAAHTRTISSLAILHVHGLDEVRLRRGRAAVDGVLAKVAETLKAHVRASDIVGALDGGDFAVILTLSEGRDAEEKVNALCRGIAPHLTVRGDPQATLAVAWGVNSFSGDDDADQVVERADADLRRRWGNAG